MPSMPFLPLGRVQIFQVECPNIIAFGTLTNPDGPLKLGGFTNVPGNAAASYLLISSQADGVHLNEPVNNKIFLDSPLNTTQPFQAVSITSTGNGSIGGDLAVGGATRLQAVAVAGTAAFTSSVSVAGPLSVNSLTASGLTALQGNTAVGGSLQVAGPAVLQQSLACGPLTALGANITNNLIVGNNIYSTGLTASGGAALGSLTVIGNSTLNTLSTASTASFGAGVTVASDTSVGGGLTVAGAAGLSVPGGALSLSGVTLAATSNSCAISVGGSTALMIDASQNLSIPSGALSVKSVNGNNGQALVLKGADVAGTVHVAGNFVVDGDYETADKVNMQVEDLLVTLAHSSTSPKPDSVADGAGLQIEGSSGFAKSIIWKNNLGLAYNGTTGSVPTSDGLSYFQVQGGNLMLTRTIPAANHVSRSSASNTWQPDSVQTVVSYAFRIDDRENLQVAKVQGTDYSSPATGGGYQAIGQTAQVCATYEVSTTS